MKQQKQAPLKPLTSQEQEQEQEQDKEDPTGSLSASPPPTEQQLLDGTLGRESLQGQKTEVPPCPYDVLIGLYHDLCPTMAGVRLDLFKAGKRADAMLARWKWVMTAKAVVGEKAGQRMATTREEGVTWFRKFFAYVAASAFLRGEMSGSGGRRWAADIGWLMKLDNFEKVLEGKYHQAEVEHA